MIINIQTNDITSTSLTKHVKDSSKRHLTEAAHVGVGGEGLILGHLVTHLSEGLFSVTPPKNATK